MGRWSQYDEDEHRLPEGMQRVGYDADSQAYTFQDSDGSYWESAPGNRYGTLKPLGRSNTVPSRPNMFADPPSATSRPSASSKDSTPPPPPYRPTPRGSAAPPPPYTPEPHVVTISRNDPFEGHEPPVNGGENPWAMMSPFLLLVCLTLLLVFHLLN